jgi:ABC-type transporter Mla subunit MlaD
MESPTMQQPPPSVSLPVNLVADLQDSLMMAMTDLNRLEGLLDHATGNLLERFGSANSALSHLANNQNDDIARIRQSLHQAVTELQFHDMATQLIVHTGKVLQGCAWKLAEEAMEAEEGELPVEISPMPDRPSPVTQSEMDAGAIELF